MLTAQVLAMMRATTAKFLTETCTIEQEMNSTGEFGQPVPVWTPIATNVACRVILARQGYRPTAANVGGQEKIVDEYRIICPYGTVLATNQRITVSTGEVYQVVSLITDRTDETDTQAVVVRAR